MTLPDARLERLAVDTIRTLSIDGVQQANSGHPGAPMGAAPMAYALWTRHLRHAPTHPDWPEPRPLRPLGRPRLDAPLLAAPPDRATRVSLDDLKSLPPVGLHHAGPPRVRHDAGRRGHHRPAGPGPRQRASAWRSPSAGWRPSSTGPATTIIDHRTYVICSDGDLQEGISAEAARLAGHLRLGKLIVAVRRQPHPARRPHRAGVQRGRARAASTPTAGTPSASRTATTSRRSPRRSTPRRPTPGRRSSPSGPTSASAARTSRTRQKAHGAPLGPDEVRLTKEAYGWDPDKTFFVPDEARRAVPPRRRRRARRCVADWEPRMDAYAAAFPAEAAELRRRLAGAPARRLGRRPAVLRDRAPRSPPATPARTRSRRWRPRCPELFGGSADLSESNLTDVKANGHDHFEADNAGRNLRFGVREHAMGAHRQRHRVPRRVPARTCATFLTFSDYMRGAVRLAALSGPARDLRLDARLRGPRRGRPDPPAGRALRGAAGDPEPVVRPARATPTRRPPPGRWRWSGRRSRARPGPVALALTRQKLPTLPGTRERAREGVRRGGYVLREAAERRTPDADPDRARAPSCQLCARGRRGARGGRDRDPRREPAVLGALRGAGRRRTAKPSCRRPCASASPSRPASRWAGSAGPATRARSSGSTTSAPAPRPGRSSRSSASPRTSVADGRRGGSSATACGARGVSRRRADAATTATDPRAEEAHDDAHRVRSRPCRGRVQGRADREAARPPSATRTS